MSGINETDLNDRTDNQFIEDPNDDYHEQPEENQEIEDVEIQEGDETIDFDLSKSRSRVNQSKGRTPQTGITTKKRQQRHFETTVDKDVTDKDILQNYYSLKENTSSKTSQRPTPYKSKGSTQKSVPNQDIIDDGTDDINMP